MLKMIGAEDARELVEGFNEQRWRLAGEPRRAMRLEYGSAAHPVR
jgi:hypothetical protein